MNTIGSRISEIIASKRLKNVQFADILKIDQSYVTQLVSGKRNPSARLMESICKSFSISRQWLENGEGEMYIETNTAMIDRLVAEYNGSEVFRAILETYMSLPDDSRRAVEEFVARLMDYKQNGAPTDIMTLDDLPRPEEPAQSDLVQDV